MLTFNVRAQCPCIKSKLNGFSFYARKSFEFVNIVQNYNIQINNIAILIYQICKVSFVEAVIMSLITWSIYLKKNALLR